MEKLSSERILPTEIIEGEIALVIQYDQGRSHAVDVLQGALALIQSIDRLDHVLLSSISTSLEPVSILNDVQKSSLKILLARALKSIPDEHIKSMEWKKWLGPLLVKGKYLLLKNINADTPELARQIKQLEPDYQNAPGMLTGYLPPSVVEVRDAMDGVAKARAAFVGQTVTIQTELGDIELPESATTKISEEAHLVQETITNHGQELFKVKQPDLIGQSQWSVIRNGRTVKVEILHREWLAAYHARQFAILPGDSLKCAFEETVSYDAMGSEIDRRLAVIEVLNIIQPSVQAKLLD